MIQFLKGHQHKGRTFVIGQKVSLIPELEKDLIEQGIAAATTWDGKDTKMKTNLFKPKDNGGNS